ncbi:TIGR02444 family protein [Pseudomonas chlororaphis subsp. aurantiaca]|uniref:TIGR02444 family protein n=1 Tax=Pseudomonas chlororaphis TaxID=587753 RepID=UPI0027DCF713|nr:TIGR02444 family protein [Pseudomonas chlororaphis]WMI99729.1 TIGR02444 family protein [Pseudomonas chlororaphis subsp. aurantiaca]
MSSDLWSFTLETYARPGVEEACLNLQAAGANVCLLLCAAWLGARGVACTAQRLQQLQTLGQPWHDEVVRPLRQLRTQWRPAASADPELAVLREQVKALELEAERQLLLRLEALAGEWSEDEAQDLTNWLEGLAAEAANLNRDALQALRVAVTGA